MARFILLMALLGCLSHATAGWARDSGDMDSMVERSTELEAKGDWRGALDLYRQIRARTGGKPPWGIAARHSAAAEELELYAEAATMLRYAMQQRPAPSPDAQPEAGADDEATAAPWEKRMEGLLEKVGRLRMRVQPVGAEVFVDGESVGVAPIEEDIFVMPGPREIIVTRTGYEPLRRTLSVVPGKRDTAQLKLSARSDQLPPRLAPPPSESESESSPGAFDEDEGLSPAELGRIVGIGVGAAGIVAAVLMGVAYSSRDEKAEKLRQEAIDVAGPNNTCGDKSPLKDTTCKKLGQTLQARNNLGTAAIAAGIGGGLVLAGGLLSLLIPTGDDEDEAAVSFTPTLGGAMIRGRF